MDMKRATERDFGRVKQLYKTAFPKDERSPFFLLKKRHLQNKGNMIVFEQDGEFLGFVYTVSNESMVYLFYFAVDDSKRGGGIGSMILSKLKEIYKNRPIFLAREIIDDSHSNNDMRIRRRNFYMRNGFTDIPYKIREASVIYDVMSTHEDLNPSDYTYMVNDFIGSFYSKFVKIDLIG